MEINQNVSLSGCTNKGLSDLAYGCCTAESPKYIIPIKECMFGKKKKSLFFVLFLNETLLTKYCISMYYGNEKTNSCVLAPCNGGKNCHQGNALIDFWKPKVSFMVMHLYLLKEPDCSHFLLLLEHRAVLFASPLAESISILWHQGYNCNTGYLAASPSQFIEWTCSSGSYALVFHSMSLVLVSELELVEGRVHFDLLEKNQQSKVCREK